MTFFLEFLEPTRRNLEEYLIRGIETLQQISVDQPATMAALLYTLLYLAFLVLFERFEDSDAFRDFVVKNRFLRPFRGTYQSNTDTEATQEEEDADLSTHSNRETQSVAREPILSPSSLATPTRLSKAFDLSTSLDMSFLNDLAPPFVNPLDTLAQDRDLQPWISHVDSPDVTHFCFLVHGYRSVSKDLAYMQMAMQRMAATEKRKRAIREGRSSMESDENSDGEDSALSDHTPPPSPPPSIDGADEEETIMEKSSTTVIRGDVPIHDMVVHNAICNEHKTNDGIVNGGDRLVEEMRAVIAEEMTKRHPELDNPANDAEPKLYNVTVSMVGNSLGGLFGRYAIAKVVERHCVLEEESNCYILDGLYRLHLNIFCTTATPHLGISRHTYVKIPRTAEIALAHSMGNTGRDIFRLNDLLHDMATAPAYLGPLSKFRKRIAYANAYATDFPVPASTAAFLSESSRYPHHFDQKSDSDTDSSDEADGDGLIIGTFYTPRQTTNRDDDSTSETTSVINGSDPLPQDSEGSQLEDEDEGDVDEQLKRQLHRMSRSLDSLGWKKVFVDVRNKLPNAELPSALLMLLQNPDPQLATDASELNLQKLGSKHKIVESKALATAVALPTDNRVALPFGHNMLVAFSRTRISSFMNQGGRPVVDGLAKELVENIFSWNEDSDGVARPIST